MELPSLSFCQCMLYTRRKTPRCCEGKKDVQYGDKGERKIRGWKDEGKNGEWVGSLEDANNRVGQQWSEVWGEADTDDNFK